MRLHKRIVQLMAWITEKLNLSIYFLFIPG